VCAKFDLTIIEKFEDEIHPALKHTGAGILSISLTFRRLIAKLYQVWQILDQEQMDLR